MAERSSDSGAPIRVLHVIHSFIAGGVERQLIELLKGMRREPGFESEVVLLSNEVEYDSFWTLGVKAHFLPRAIRYDPLIFFRLTGIVREFRPDIVHAWSGMCSVYAAPVAKLVGAKFVNGCIRSATAGLTLRDSDYFRCRLMQPFSDVTVSNSLAGLAAYRIRKDKGLCIFNGFDETRLAHISPADEVRRAIGVSTKHVVGMVASFSDRKDWDTFFAAARCMVKTRDDVTFVAVGDGPNLGRYRAALDSDPHPRIRLLGLRQDVEDIANIFTVGILASNVDIHGEGISNALMEYMALAKPAIATDCGGNAELVENGITGYLIPGRGVDALIAHADRLLDDVDLSCSMGQSGQQRIRHGFSVLRMTRAYTELYGRLAIDRRRPINWRRALPAVATAKRPIYPARQVLIEFPRRIDAGEALDIDAIEAEFFSRIKLNNGVFKTTGKERLDSVNEAFAGALSAAGSRPSEILDVAASSGVASLRWMDDLARAGLEPRMTISDLSLTGFLVSPITGFKVLVDRENNPLEFEICGRSFCAHIRRVDWFTGTSILVLLLKALYRYLASPGRLAAPMSDRPEREPQGAALPVLLVSHAIRSRGDIACIDDDITATNAENLKRRFDVIRAANILQYDYFDQGSIMRSLAVLKERLKGEGSWLILARTHGAGTNDASIFRLEQEGFVLKARVGAGSEIESLALGLG